MMLSLSGSTALSSDLTFKVGQICKKTEFLFGTSGLPGWGTEVGCQLLSEPGTLPASPLQSHCGVPAMWKVHEFLKIGLSKTVLKR